MLDTYRLACCLQVIKAQLASTPAVLHGRMVAHAGLSCNTTVETTSPTVGPCIGADFGESLRDRLYFPRSLICKGSDEAFCGFCDGGWSDHVSIDVTTDMAVLEKIATKGTTVNEAIVSEAKAAIRRILVAWRGHPETMDASNECVAAFPAVLQAVLEKLLTGEGPDTQPLLSFCQSAIVSLTGTSESEQEVCYMVIIVLCYCAQRQERVRGIVKSQRNCSTADRQSQRKRCHVQRDQR